MNVNKQGGVILGYKSTPIDTWQLAEGFAGWEKMKGV